MGVNDDGYESKFNKTEIGILDRVLPLQRKHLVTHSYGDGEIARITRKDDLTGIYVYFHSNPHGEIRLEGEEFLQEVAKVL